MQENRLRTVMWYVAPDQGKPVSQLEPVQGCELPPSRKKLSLRHDEILEAEIERLKLPDLLAFELRRTFMDVYSHHWPGGLNQAVFMTHTQLYLEKFVTDLNLLIQLENLTATIFPRLFEEIR